MAHTKKSSAQPEYDVAEAAKAARTTVTLLRMWEYRYAWPNPRRRSNGYRIYTQAQVDEIAEVVSYLKNTGEKITTLIDSNGTIRWPESHNRPRIHRDLIQHARVYLAKLDPRVMPLADEAIQSIDQSDAMHLRWVLARAALDCRPSDRHPLWIGILAALRMRSMIGLPFPDTVSMVSYIQRQDPSYFPMLHVTATSVAKGEPL